MESDVHLCNAALDIQMHRGWLSICCCELSGLAPSTWGDAVTRGQRRQLTPTVKAKLQAFVDAYQGNTAAPPRPPKDKRGIEHHRSKRTPEMIARILSSNAKGVVLAREFGVSSSLITRVRQEGRAS